MDKFNIVGGKPLMGKITIAGAKNAALPLLCASILSAEKISISNVPHLRDIHTLKHLLLSLGANITEQHAPLDRQAMQDPSVIMPSQSLTLSFPSILNAHAPYDAVKTMRASVLVLGPMLARHGFARVALPGGCAIGARPIDIHLKGLVAMGAEINIEHGDVVAKVASGRLVGARIVMETVTVTGTENLLMAAVLARGQTVLENAAQEPEVVDLAVLLKNMGAKIEGIGTSRLVIEGVESLHGAYHEVIPDRIETGTLLCAVAACGGEVSLENTAPQHLDAVIDKLREAGAKINIEGNTLTITMNQRPKAISLRTDPYPGFPTDMQAQVMALDTVASGSGLISETIFENRFLHATELMRMGAKIRVDTHSAFVEGVAQLQGAPVMATDLRASACLVIAGLAAKGTTIIDRIYHLDRGYAQLERKLARLGAQVSRI
jgi:UDP-N-acetylglucosamine 1-carboxyvinyltransferase